MATYSDIDDIRSQIFAVTDEEVGGTILNRSAEMAYNIINSALSGFYTVPFSSTPGIILDISDLLTKGLAILLDTRRGNPFTEEDLKTGEIGLAMKMLEQIRKGAMTIPGVSRSSTTGPWVNRESYTPIFDVDSVMNHFPDPDLLDAIADERE